MPTELGPIEGVALLGAGTAFPPRTLDNEEVLRSLRAHLWPAEQALDDDYFAFVSRSVEASLGLRRRAWIHEVGTPLDPRGPGTLELSVAAARAALADAGVDGSELGLVLCATSTPHRMSSGVSAAVGAALGTRAACMDVRTGCSGALFALATAALFQQASGGKAVIIGADTFSKVLPPTSRLAALSLGDGAGALVVGPGGAGARLEAVYLETDGNLGQLITTDGALPPTAEEISRGGYLLSGAPAELTAVVPEKYVQAISAVLRRAGVTPDAVELYVPHQTSTEVIRTVAARVGLSPERTFVNVSEHANIGAAGWLVAVAEAKAQGRLRRGMRLLTAAVGGGMSWAAALWTVG